jgi:hypothetical protein
MTKDILPGGAADNIPKKDFDQEKLDEGATHEKEHTENKQVASEIARDHLLEDPNYYKKLKAIESKKYFKKKLEKAILNKSNNLEKMSRPRITFPKMGLDTRPDQNVQLLEEPQQVKLFGRKIADQQIKDFENKKGIKLKPENRTKEMKRLSGAPARRLGRDTLGLNYSLDTRDISGALAGKARSKYEAPDEEYSQKIKDNADKYQEAKTKSFDDYDKWRKEVSNYAPGSTEYYNHIAKRPKMPTAPRKPSKKKVETKDLSPEQIKARGQAVDSTIEHEALHGLLGQVERKYGSHVYGKVVKDLLNQYSPDTLKTLSDWVENRGYKRNRGSFNQELLTHARDLLVNAEKRKSFKNYLTRTIRDNPNDHYDKHIKNLKQGHQKSYEYAQNLTPEAFGNWIPNSENLKVAADKFGKSESYFKDLLNKSEDLEKTSKNIKAQRKKLFGTQGNPNPKSKFGQKQIEQQKKFSQLRYKKDIVPSKGKINQKTGERKVGSIEGTDKPDWRGGNLESQWNPGAITHEFGHLEQMPEGRTPHQHQTVMDKEVGESVKMGGGPTASFKHPSEVQARAVENPLRRRMGLPPLTTNVKVKENEPKRIVIGTEDQPAAVRYEDKKGQLVDQLKSGKLLSPEMKERTDMIDSGELAFDPNKNTWVKGTSIDSKINARARAANKYFKKLINKSEIIFIINDPESYTLEKAIPRAIGEKHPEQPWIAAKHPNGVTMWHSDKQKADKDDEILNNTNRIDHFANTLPKRHQALFRGIINSIKKDPNRHFIPTEENGVQKLRARHIKSLLSGQDGVTLDSSNPDVLTITRHSHSQGKNQGLPPIKISFKGVSSGNVEKNERRTAFGTSTNVFRRLYKHILQAGESLSKKEAEKQDTSAEDSKVSGIELDSNGIYNADGRDSNTTSWSTKTNLGENVMKNEILKPNSAFRDMMNKRKQAKETQRQADLKAFYDAKGQEVPEHLKTPQAPSALNYQDIKAEHRRNKGRFKAADIKEQKARLDAIFAPKTNKLSFNDIKKLSVKKKD